MAAAAARSARVLPITTSWPASAAIDTRRPPARHQGTNVTAAQDRRDGGRVLRRTAMRLRSIPASPRFTGSRFRPPCRFVGDMVNGSLPVPYGGRSLPIP